MADTDAVRSTVYLEPDLRRADHPDLVAADSGESTDPPPTH